MVKIVREYIDDKKWRREEFNYDSGNNLYKDAYKWNIANILLFFTYILCPSIWYICSWKAKSEELRCRWSLELVGNTIFK